jgi:hypothetical protein
MQDIEQIRKLTKQGKALFNQWQQAEDAIEGGFDAALDRAWRFGKLLNTLKDEVGHGEWIKFRDDAFTGLDDRKAQTCQALDHNNPNARNSTQLTKESVRKFRYGYVPVKERKKQKGNVKFNRPAHYSVLATEGDKLMQRIKAGHEHVTAEMLHDLQPLHDWLSKLYAEAR